MKTMKHLLLLFAAAAFVPGCAIFGGETIKPAFQTEGKKIAIVPFAYKGEDFFESKLGASIARQVQNLIQTKNPGLVFVDAEPLFEMLSRTAVEDLDWNEVKKIIGADYVLFGAIGNFTLRDPKVIGLLRGSVVVDLKLIDLGAGGKTVFAKPVSHKYPPGDYEATAGEENEQAVEKFLIAGIVNKIAGNFYERPKESEE